MASPGNQYCANCIGTLSFPIHWWAGLYASRYRAQPRTTIYSTTFARRRNRYALVIFTTRKHSLGGCTMDRATGVKTVTGWAHIVSPISGTIPTVLHCGCSYARRRTDQCWFQALFLDGECPLPKKTNNYPFTPSGCQIVCSKFFFGRGDELYKYRVGQKTGLFFRLDNFVTVSPRKACSMSKFSKFTTELVQTKLHVGTLCLDDHHQSFWQLIDRSIQCVLA